MGCCEKRKVFNEISECIQNINLKNINPFKQNINLQSESINIANKYINLMEKFPNEFFCDKNKDELKKIPKICFKRLSQSCIGNLSPQTLLLLDNSDILDFFPKNFFNYIKNENFIRLPPEFFKLKYLTNASEDLLIKIIKSIKL